MFNANETSTSKRKPWFWLLLLFLSVGALAWTIHESKQPQELQTNLPETFEHQVQIPEPLPEIAPAIPLEAQVEEPVVTPEETVAEIAPEPVRSQPVRRQKKIQREVYRSMAQASERKTIEEPEPILPIQTESTFDFHPSSPTPSYEVAQQSPPEPEPVPEPVTPVDVVPHTKSENSKPEESFTREPIIFWANLGLGFNYNFMNQTVPGDDSLKVSGFSAPSYNFEAGFFLVPELGFEFSYRQTPVQFKSSRSLTIYNESFSAQNLSGELLYRPNPKGRSVWTYRFGFQHASDPFFEPLTDNEAEIVEALSSSVTIGIGYERLLSEKLKSEIELKYALPLDSSSQPGFDHQLQPKLELELEAGVTYKIKDNLNVGAAWNMHFKDRNFEHINQATETEFDGNERHIRSSFEIKLGVEF